MSPSRDEHEKCLKPPPSSTRFKFYTSFINKKQTHVLLQPNKCTPLIMSSHFWGFLSPARKQSQIASMYGIYLPTFTIMTNQSKQLNVDLPYMDALGSNLRLQPFALPNSHHPSERPFGGLKNTY